MKKIDHCQCCNKEVRRSPTSAAKITCRECRAIKRCGTTAGYSAGCRCQSCKDAKAASMREYVARRKAEGRPVPRSEWRAYEDIECDCCGVTFSREKRNDKRYLKAYCSILCRDYTQWGPLSKKIPKRHWVYMVGATCEWTPPKPKGPFTITCGWCEAKHVTEHSTTEYCSDTCKTRASRNRRRAREYGAHGTYTWGQVVRLWAAFDKACAYCRQHTELADIQAEHVVALAQGGANNVGNILPSCGPCNSDKRDLTMDEWRVDRARRNLPTVITHWTKDDTRYAHLTMRPLTLAA